jgi:tRNA (guanine37-N1)-methyltransferase
VLGDECSHVEDSFTAGLLDCPQYTRPEEVDGRQVPDVLLGGDHEAVRRWRLKQALGQTWRKRPALIAARRLTVEEEALLKEFKAEWALNSGDENA